MKRLVITTMLRNIRMTITTGSIVIPKTKVIIYNITMTNNKKILIIMMLTIVIMLSMLNTITRIIRIPLLIMLIEVLLYLYLMKVLITANSNDHKKS